MQFRLWLENRDNAYSWLDPNGKFHPLEKRVVHGSWAKQYIKIHHPTRELFNPMEELFKKGWQRIIYVGDQLVTQNDFIGPNHIQKQALIDLAITEKFNRIYFDNGADEFIVWTAGDQI